MILTIITVKFGKTHSRFEFFYNEQRYTAYVLYYDDGHCDVEVDYDNQPLAFHVPEAHDRALEIAHQQRLVA